MSRLVSGAPRSGEVTSPTFFEPTGSRLSHAERAALEGLLSEGKPAVALAIGTVDSETVDRLARHSAEVHYFDVATPQFTPPGNLIVHTGDRRGDSMRVLGELAAAGRTADFILLDAGLDTEGVRLDMEALLDSPGTRDTLIVVCDAMSEPVRTGLRQLEAEGWPKVVHIDFDFVGGRMVQEGTTPGELEGGLGVVVTRAGAGAIGKRAAETRHFDTFELLSLARPRALAGVRNRRRLAELTADIGEDQDRFVDPVAERDRLLGQLRDVEANYAQLREVWARTVNSFSWRITTPLRTVKARVKRLVA